MSLQEEILGFYKESLESTGTLVNDEGMVMKEQTADVSLPVTVLNNEPLVLPTKERQKAGDWTGVQPFHPLSENSLRGESVVLKKLRVLTAARISDVIVNVMETLMTIAADPSRHAKLPPKASEFLDPLTKVDAKTLKALGKVLDLVSVTGDHRLVSFYFRRPGEQRKESYTRICRVDLPILDELENSESTIFGVKMRQNDKPAILGLFAWLLDLDIEQNKKELKEQVEVLYSKGTHTLTVPYFYTLMSSYAKLAEALNNKIKLFKKVEPEMVKLWTTDLGWAEHLENLARFRDVIPALKGNEGASATHPTKQAVETTPVNPAKPPVQHPPVAPAAKLRMTNVNVPIGSAGNEAPEPEPEQAPHVPVSPAQIFAPQPTQQVFAVPQPENNGKLKMPPPVQNGYGHPPVMPLSNSFGMIQPMAPAPTTAREAIRQQQYQQYQQSPSAYFNPAVHNSVSPAAVNPRFAPVNNGWGNPVQPSIQQPIAPLNIAGRRW